MVVFLYRIKGLTCQDHFVTLQGMTPEQFAYWLQGFFEMTDAKELTPKQVEMIKNHLALVFTNVTNPIIIKTQTTGSTSTQPVPYDPFAPYDFDYWKKLEELLKLTGKDQPWQIERIDCGQSTFGPSSELTRLC